MLRSLKDLEGYKVSATDGEIGSVVNFLLDDDSWVIRYLVVETGHLLSKRRVLVSPISFREPDWTTKRFHLALTMDKIKNSPGIDLDKPVSRQHEHDYYKYYGYPHYWGFGGPGAIGLFPSWPDRGGSNRDLLPKPDEPGDVHLRSAKEVRGYHVQGRDAAVGHVADFIVDDESWHLRYLVVDTSNWWLGKKVLVSPRWASRVSWEEDKVFVDLTRQAIKDSPEWNGEAAIEREYEARLHDHYGRPTYWDDGEIKPVPNPSHTDTHAG